MTDIEDDDFPPSTKLNTSGTIDCKKIHQKLCLYQLYKLSSRLVSNLSVAKVKFFAENIETF